LQEGDVILWGGIAFFGAIDGDGAFTGNKVLD